MNVNHIIIRPLVAVLAFALCGAPEALAQTQQSPATAPQTGSSQDATQQPMTAPATQSQQQSWPTQDTTSPDNATAPNATQNGTQNANKDANAPATTAPSTTAPNATAPNAAQQAPSTTQPTAPADQQRQRVVLGPNGQTQTPSAQQNRGTTVDPSAAPIAPAPTAQPTAPTETPEDQTQPPANPQPQPEAKKPVVQQQQPVPEPLGTAAAEGVKTAGNGASKPAGAAIAPAKQNRKRSLLIKLGAIAAVGVAVGTVAALSRGTPGNPPNTNTSASTAGR